MQHSTALYRASGDGTLCANTNAHHAENFYTSQQHPASTPGDAGISFHHYAHPTILETVVRHARDRHAVSAPVHAAPEEIHNSRFYNNSTSTNMPSLASQREPIVENRDARWQHQQQQTAPLNSDGIAAEARDGDHLYNSVQPTVAAAAHASQLSQPPLTRSNGGSSGANLTSSVHHVRESIVALDRAFSLFDSRNTGRVTRRQFLAALVRNGGHASQSEMLADQFMAVGIGVGGGNAVHNHDGGGGGDGDAIDYRAFMLYLDELADEVGRGGGGRPNGADGGIGNSVGGGDPSPYPNSFPAAPPQRPFIQSPAPPPPLHAPSNAHVPAAPTELNQQPHLHAHPQPLHTLPANSNFHQHQHASDNLSGAGDLQQRLSTAVGEHLLRSYSTAPAAEEKEASAANNHRGFAPAHHGHVTHSNAATVGSGGLQQSPSPQPRQQAQQQQYFPPRGQRQARQPSASSVASSSAYSVYVDVEQSCSPATPPSRRGAPSNAVGGLAEGSAPVHRSPAAIGAHTVNRPTGAPFHDEERRGRSSSPSSSPVTVTGAHQHGNAPEGPHDRYGNSQSHSGRAASGSVRSQTQAPEAERPRPPVASSSSEAFLVVEKALFSNAAAPLVGDSPSAMGASPPPRHVVLPGFEEEVEDEEKHHRRWEGGDSKATPQDVAADAASEQQMAQNFAQQPQQQSQQQSSLARHHHSQMQQQQQQGNRSLTDDPRTTKSSGHYTTAHIASYATPAGRDGAAAHPHPQAHAAAGPTNISGVVPMPDARFAEQHHHQHQEQRRQQHHEGGGPQRASVRGGHTATAVAAAVATHLSAVAVAPPDAYASASVVAVPPPAAQQRPPQPQQGVTTPAVVAPPPQYAANVPHQNSGGQRQSQSQSSHSNGTSLNPYAAAVSRAVSSLMAAAPSSASPPHRTTEQHLANAASGGDVASSRRRGSPVDDAYDGGGAAAGNQRAFETQGYASRHSTNDNAGYMYDGGPASSSHGYTQLADTSVTARDDGTATGAGTQWGSPTTPAGAENAAAAAGHHYSTDEDEGDEGKDGGQREGTAPSRSPLAETQRWVPTTQQTQPTADMTTPSRQHHPNSSGAAPSPSPSATTPSAARRQPLAHHAYMSGGGDTPSMYAISDLSSEGYATAEASPARPRPLATVPSPPSAAPSAGAVNVAVATAAAANAVADGRSGGGDGAQRAPQQHSASHHSAIQLASWGSAAPSDPTTAAAAQKHSSFAADDDGGAGGSERAAELSERADRRLDFTAAVPSAASNAHLPSSSSVVRSRRGSGGSNVGNSTVAHPPPSEEDRRRRCDEDDEEAVGVEKLPDPPHQAPTPIPAASAAAYGAAMARFGGHPQQAPLSIINGGGVALPSTAAPANNEARGHYHHHQHPPTGLQFAEERVVELSLSPTTHDDGGRHNMAAAAKEEDLAPQDAPRRYVDPLNSNNDALPSPQKRHHQQASNHHHHYNNVSVHTNASSSPPSLLVPLLSVFAALDGDGDQRVTAEDVYFGLAIDRAIVPTLSLEEVEVLFESIGATAINSNNADVSGVSLPSPSRRAAVASGVGFADFCTFVSRLRPEFISQIRDPSRWGASSPQPPPAFSLSGGGAALGQLPPSSSARPIAALFHDVSSAASGGGIGLGLARAAANTSVNDSVTPLRSPPRKGGGGGGGLLVSPPPPAPLSSSPPRPSLSHTQTHMHADADGGGAAGSPVAHWGEVQHHQQWQRRAEGPAAPDGGGAYRGDDDARDDVSVAEGGAVAMSPSAADASHSPMGVGLGMGGGGEPSVSMSRERRRLERSRALATLAGLLEEDSEEEAAGAPRRSRSANRNQPQPQQSMGGGTAAAAASVPNYMRGTSASRGRSPSPMSAAAVGSVHAVNRQSSVGGGGGGGGSNYGHSQQQQQSSNRLRRFDAKEAPISVTVRRTDRRTGALVGSAVVVRPNGNRSTSRQQQPQQGGQRRGGGGGVMSPSVGDANEAAAEQRWMRPTASSQMRAGRGIPNGSDGDEGAVAADSRVQSAAVSAGGGWAPAEGRGGAGPPQQWRVVSDVAHSAGDTVNGAYLKASSAGSADAHLVRSTHGSRSPSAVDPSGGAGASYAAGYSAMHSHHSSSHHHNNLYGHHDGYGGYGEGRASQHPLSAAPLAAGHLLMDAPTADDAAHHAWVDTLPAEPVTSSPSRFAVPGVQRQHHSGAVTGGGGGRVGAIPVETINLVPRQREGSGNANAVAAKDSSGRGGGEPTKGGLKQQHIPAKAPAAAATKRGGSTASVSPSPAAPHHTTDRLLRLSPTNAAAAAATASLHLLPASSSSASIISPPSSFPLPSPFLTVTDEAFTALCAAVLEGCAANDAHRSGAVPLRAFNDALHSAVEATVSPTSSSPTAKGASGGGGQQQQRRQVSATDAKALLEWLVDSVRGFITIDTSALAHHHGAAGGASRSPSQSAACVYLEYLSFLVGQWPPMAAREAEAVAARARASQSQGQGQGKMGAMGGSAAAAASTKGRSVASVASSAATADFEVVRPSNASQQHHDHQQQQQGARPSHPSPSSPLSLVSATLKMAKLIRIELLGALAATTTTMLNAPPPSASAMLQRLKEAFASSDLHAQSKGGNGSSTRNGYVSERAFRQALLGAYAHSSAMPPWVMARCVKMAKEPLAGALPPPPPSASSAKGQQQQSTAASLERYQREQYGLLAEAYGRAVASGVTAGRASSDADADGGSVGVCDYNYFLRTLELCEGF